MGAFFEVNDDYIFWDSKSTITFIVHVINEFLPKNFYEEADKAGKEFCEHMRYHLEEDYPIDIMIFDLNQSDFIKIAHALEQGIEHMKNREWAHQFYIKIGYVKKESDINAGEQDYYKKRELFRDPSTKRKYLEEYKERFEKEWPNHNVSVEKYFDSSSVMYSMVPIETYFDMYMRHLDILTEILSEMKKDPRYTAN
ncbi:MAG: hypothetical protein ACOCXQ_00490 [Patescibacteria group bacterium]